MKRYHLYLFTQEECPPCDRVKHHLSGLPEAQQQELDIVPMKVPSGERTALAVELDVELTPTLVVCHENLACEYDENGDEICSDLEVHVETIVGGQKIIDNLEATLSAYTYALDED
jgi:hypothetical protein